jgi:hypothetical protein
MLVFPYLFQLPTINRSALANSDQRTYPDQGGSWNKAWRSVRNKSVVGGELVTPVKLGSPLICFFQAIVKITCTCRKICFTSSWFSVWEKSVVDLVSLGGKITLLLNKKSIRPVRRA